MARNLIPKACLAALSVPVIYLVAILAASNLLYSNALGDWAFGRGIVATTLILKVLPTLAVVINVVVAVLRAARERDYLWLVSVVVLWPLSFWYTLVETRPSSTGRPLRGSA